jgi:site-specific DNA-methyltransferase (cytosine-N4-specific)
MATKSRKVALKSPVDTPPSARYEFPFTHACEGSGIVVGDSRQVLGNFPDNVFQSCITSPPYWGLRDYGIADQIGAEMDLEQYIADVTGVFREVRRVLRDDGTLWLNIGDAYTSGNRTWRHTDKKNPARSMSYRPPTPAGLKPKDLIGIPWKLAFALQADGWFLRSDIIWYKPNCQPESVKDRPTRSHEYVFLLTKNEDYLYNCDAVREACLGSRTEKRNRRTVWNINTEAFPEAHFATFPTSLVEPMVFAGSGPGDLILDPFFGSGTVGAVCQIHGRRFAGIELKPEFAQIALRRLGWEQSPDEHKAEASGPSARSSNLPLLPPPVAAEALFQGRVEGDRRSRYEVVSCTRVAVLA